LDRIKLSDHANWRYRTQAIKSLKKAGIEFVDDFLKFLPEDIKNIKYFGRKTMDLAEHCLFTYYQDQLTEPWINWHVSNCRRDCCMFKAMRWETNVKTR
jgi:hypothetical protein